MSLPILSFINGIFSNLLSCKYEYQADDYAKNYKLGIIPN